MMDITTATLWCGAFLAGSYIFYYMSPKQVQTTIRSFLLFAYNCFLKPISKSSTNQQVALESFYKGQAQIYDNTRSKLLKGREVMLQLCAAHHTESRRKIKNLIWVDVCSLILYKLDTVIGN